MICVNVISNNSTVTVLLNSQAFFCGALPLCANVFPSYSLSGLESLAYVGTRMHTNTNQNIHTVIKSYRQQLLGLEYY